jgi:hypothetical protein
MDQVANSSVAPAHLSEYSSGAHPSGTEVGEAVPANSNSFWSSFLMTVAMSSIAIGIIWDISWHETVGRDTFWTPAHMAIYLGGVLGGCVGGWLAVQHTFLAGPVERGASVSVFGARAPLGAWVAIWGALAMVTSAPFDDWWHNAYGLDVRIVSPPHVVLGLGMFAISAGALLLVLSRQNRLQDVSSTKGSGMFIFAGGVFVLMGSVFLLEYIFPNMQHAALFYKVCALMYPARLVALSCSGRISWPATRVAAVYMTFLCVMDWILTSFRAHPKLAPIFNPVTHMVALPFPLLLIFPALAIDWILRRAGEAYTTESPTGPGVVQACPTSAGIRGIFRRIGLAILLGVVFFAILMAVQWYFSKFMLSPYARNWFFMGDRVFGYNFRRGDWQFQFWHGDPKSGNYDPITMSAIALTLGFAIVSSWVGLFFGNWMRKVRR